MTASRSQGTRSKVTPKGTPKKNAAAKASPKHFLMPTVDLEGLGGDVDDELPPLDLASFTSKQPAAGAMESVTAPFLPTQDHAQPPAALRHEPSGSVDSTVTTPDQSRERREEPPAGSVLPSLSSSTSLSAEPAALAKVDPPAAQQPFSAPAAPAVSTSKPLKALTSQDTEWQPNTMPTAGDITATSRRSAAPTSVSPAVRTNATGTHETRPWSTTSAGSAGPARCPRRAASHAFENAQTRSRREERLKELLSKAPCYASLLESYTLAQSGKEAYQKRNIQLYGLTAQELADRITVDKAVMRAVNLPTPRFTPAHYIDAVLERALGALNPQGTNVHALETDRDIIWELAHDGLSYRDYIFADPTVASLKKPRAQCPLRIRVNQRVSRMMDILKTMPDLKTQPFEIISACLATYLQALQSEQPAFEEFWSRSLETSYE
ncbi:hypothetical protein [Streptomyces sp. NPDC007205]|uniref:hypothetical protein n=1 Tax=Streptomyces sp. NPDC007205 TaxID=3154316 RepID=UPI0033F64812